MVLKIFLHKTSLKQDIYRPDFQNFDFPFNYDSSKMARFDFFTLLEPIYKENVVWLIYTNVRETFGRRDFSA